MQLTLQRSRRNSCVLHVWDNKKLTLSDLCSIIRNTNDFFPTQKIDGTFLSCTVINNNVRFARLKRDTRNFGLDRKSFVSIYDNDFCKNRGIYLAFDRATKIIEQLVSSGNLQCDVNTWYPFEIVYKNPDHVFEQEKQCIVFHAYPIIKDGIEYINKNENIIEETVIDEFTIYNPLKVNVNNNSFFVLTTMKELLKLFDRNAEMTVGELQKENPPAFEQLKLLLIDFETKLLSRIKPKIKSVNREAIKEKLDNAIECFSNKTLDKSLEFHYKNLLNCNEIPHLEGIVFFYDDVCYKMTGSFMGINQILNAHRKEISNGR